ncbi:MAG: hypothetical protein HYT46_01955, partial [Candidatus Vogelbacteria bacterium]|nr:hypothetical protein [Candidatus Vogelbacteria bacterium]
GKSLYLDVSHTGYTPRTNYNSGTVPSSGGVRDALLTAAPATTYTLTTWIDPAGSGAISKSPNQSSFNSGAQVTLTATPAAGYAFSSWSGNCLGTNSTCILTMNANKSAYAHFTPAPATTAYTYTLTTSVMAGSGSITKNPNKTNYSAGDVVTLTANPGTGYALDFWRDDCSFINDPPPSNTCTLTINANKSVTAYFGFTLSVTKAGLGSGRSSVTSGAGINCDSNESDCLEVITPNASPSLTATPVGGYSFANWSGDISGTTNPRAITMNNAKSVTANFTGNPLHTVGIIVKKNNCTTNCYISGAAVSIEYFTPPLTDGNTISLGTTGTDGKSSTTGLREGMDWKVKAIKTGYNNYNNTTRYSVSSGTPNPYWLIILMTPS